ncbi:MAG TPA: UDP-2,3-diacylglucosamine diphosphatase [Proteobacteria bacterium]|nr:UDP-2,3-diacylglucosamine diphosphatase [Pseudomonadota bacterium]
MKAIFLADAHLLTPTEAAYQDLLRFLQQLPQDLDRLFILGDFFDFWIGGPAAPPPAYEPVLTALAEIVGQGVEIHLFAGNHELSGGPQLAARGLIWHDGAAIVELDGLRLYLAHGDQLNPEDYAYRLWRALIRHPLFLYLIERFPTALVRELALYLSRKSRHHNGRGKFIPPQVYRSGARLLKSDLKAAVIGHFHQARAERFILNGQSKTLYLLDDWNNERAYLSLQDGRFNYCNFRRSEPESGGTNRPNHAAPANFPDGTEKKTTDTGDAASLRPCDR